jgi:hypothetical protein
MKNDAKDLPSGPAEAKPRVIGYGFTCRSGPCKVFRVYDNEPELPKLPAPVEPKPTS